MYNFLQNEKLLIPNQSGFRPSGLCINQLLSIAHEIFWSFDATPSFKVRSGFLDISNAFEKVWHKELIYKLNFTGISEQNFTS